MEKKRILFVCLGNICRSPLAEGLFKKKIHEQDVAHLFEVDSCGTGNYHIGEQPDPRTIKNARQNGVVLEHVCRQLRASDFEYFDHLLVMDQSNYTNTLRVGEERYHYKVELMRKYDPRGRHENVPDPWFGGEEGFQEVFEILDRSTAHLLQSLLKGEELR